MQLGNFSLSLAVKDIAASLAFYQKLGFEIRGGDITQNWLVLRNGDCIIGLFQDMFDRNILTFNPGWDIDANKLPSFTDVRELQKKLKADGIQPNPEAEEDGSGPGYFIIVDPDGNPIMFDQHV
jgi:catechol 2,3-dioxygenase-like lactoylglutathione lyase family enzyme